MKPFLFAVILSMLLVGCDDDKPAPAASTAQVAPATPGAPAATAAPAKPAEPAYRRSVPAPLTGKDFQDFNKRNKAADNGS